MPKDRQEAKIFREINEKLFSYTYTHTHQLQKQQQ